MVLASGVLPAEPIPFHYSHGSSLDPPALRHAFMPLPHSRLQWIELQGLRAGILPDPDQYLQRRAAV